MPEWDLQKTRDLLRTRFDYAQFELARQSLGSAVDRREYARFHYHETKKILATNISVLHAEQKLFTVIFGAGDDEEQNDFHNAMEEAGAHVTACVQSLHAIADIFAHAIYYSLGFNLESNALGERQVTASSVRDKLRSNSIYPKLADSLDLLLTHEHYQYLAALANQSKHRSLVKPLLWMDMTETAEEPYRLQFQEFGYGGISHPARAILPFLEKAFNQISQVVVDTGIELTSVLHANP